MDYFTIAIATAWILAVFYTAMAVLVGLGLRISRPVVPTRLYKLMIYLIAAAFFGTGLHYFHLAYFGASRGILPSQETPLAIGANVLQVLTVLPAIFFAWYVRYRNSNHSDEDDDG